MIDHLMIEAPNHWSARQWAARACIATREGGVHTGRGTRNILATMDGGRYLEILFPDTAQRPTDNSLRISRLSRPRFAAVCCVSKDLAGLADNLRLAGGSVRGPEPYARMRPDGVALAWSLVFQDPPLADAPSLFFIDWQGSPHPSTDAAPAARIVSLWAEHPEPGGLARYLAQAGVSLEVRHGPVARWRAELAVAERRFAV